MNVNFVLAKAIQQDHLREARHNRINRLWNRRKAALKTARRRAQK